jgi:hypothetical protein
MNIFGIPFRFKWLWPRDPNEAIIPFNPSNLKLGRAAPSPKDPRTLRFANYITDLPEPPASIDYGDKVKSWGMLANDILGDCTCAGILHAIQLWLSNNGFLARFADSDAVNLYQKLCGYIPGRPETDQGGIEIDILKAWRKEPIAGCELLAFAAVDPRNWEHVKLAHWLSGSLYMGVSLPLSAQKDGLWADTNGAPGEWGGHCMVTSAYREKRGLCSFFNSKILTAITWGKEQNMTAAWVAKYCDELWVPITSAWFDKSGRAPNGFDLSALLADVRQVSLTPIN